LAMSSSVKLGTDGFQIIRFSSGLKIVGSAPNNSIIQEFHQVSTVLWKLIRRYDFNHIKFVHGSIAGIFDNDYA
jgi:hypothetical protein